MNNLTEDGLLDILSGVSIEAQEPVPQSAGPVLSSWLYDEIDSLCHKPLGRSLHRQPHEELCARIEEKISDCKFDSGGQKLLMIGVPRGTHKTTIVAENLPVVLLAKNPNLRIMVDSYRHDVSKKRLKAIQWHFENNKEFHDRFGDDWRPAFREAPWSDSLLTVSKRTMALIEPSVEASGTDRSATGAHYDVILADDLVNDINSRTREARDKVASHISDQMSVLEPNGLMILIFTTWNPDDAYARIQKIDAERERLGKKPFWDKLIRSCYDGPNGLYYPERWTHDLLDDMRAKIGSHKFAAQYLLKPVADEDKTFAMDAARIVQFDFEPRQYGGLVTVPRWARERLPVQNTLYWDPAGTKQGNKRNDDHGITVVGCDPLDRWWVHEAEGIKSTPPLIIDRIIKLLVYYHVHTLGFEEEAMQGLWIELLQIEMDKRGIPQPAFVGVHGRGVPKNERIAIKLQPRWERGAILLKPEQTKLYTQIDNFSPANEDHEDVLDSLAGHDSIARPAAPDFSYVRDENPVDRQWLERRERLKTEARRESIEGFGGSEGGAGMHGVGWAIGG